MVKLAKGVSSSSVSVQSELSLGCGRAQLRTKRSENGQTSSRRAKFFPSIAQFDPSPSSVLAHSSSVWVLFELSIGSVWAYSEVGFSSARAQFGLRLGSV